MSDYIKDAQAAAKEIQRLLLQNRAHSYLGKQTRGKTLDISNASGIMTYGSNIYKRRLVNDQAEYELCLVLDLSGSIHHTMAGSNPFKPGEHQNGVRNTIFYSWLLSRVFLTVLGKQAISVFGFNRDFIDLKELLFQHRFNQDNTLQILNKMADITEDWCQSSPVRINANGEQEAYGGSRYGGNHDGYYLLKSAEETVWTVEDPTKRIVIHFSDGQPLCGGHCGLPGCGGDKSLRLGLHNSVRKLRQSGYVCIGVGLGYKGVEEYYGELSVVANNPGEMYSKTIDIIRKQMKRGTFR